jgi:hypothetical protein
MWHKDCIPVQLPAFCQHTRHNILSLETVNKFLFIHAVLQIQCSDSVFLFFFSLVLYIRKLKILLNEAAHWSPIEEVILSQCTPQHQVIEGGRSVVMQHTNNAGMTWQAVLRVNCGHLRCWRSAAVDSTVTLPCVAQWEFAIRIHLFKLPVLSCFDMCGGWIQTSVLVPYDLRYTAWCHTLRRAYLHEILSDHLELSPMFVYILHIYENN